MKSYMPQAVADLIAKLKYNVHEMEKEVSEQKEAFNRASGALVEAEEILSSYQRQLEAACFVAQAYEGLISDAGLLGTPPSAAPTQVVVGHSEAEAEAKIEAEAPEDDESGPGHDTIINTMRAVGRPVSARELREITGVPPRQIGVLIGGLAKLQKIHRVNKDTWAVSR